MGFDKILTAHENPFPTINRAYNKTFQPGRLSIGLVAPIEANGHHPIPSLERHIERAKLADALGVASVILPLRHPAHVSKAAASVDALSAGRLLLGVASGDRPEEYPLMKVDFDNRGLRFQDSVDYIRAMGTAYPQAELSHGYLSGGADMLPKPVGARLPLIITGGSQQSPEWVAKNGDGWMTYPRNATVQGRLVKDYRERIERLGVTNKPVM